MFRKIMTTAVLGIVLAAGGSLAVAEPKLPTTPEDHFALAKGYREKAEGFRKEAADHKKMAADFRDKPAHAANKTRGGKVPAVEKMEKHCAAIAAAADKLALENEKAADYHTLRGKELQGQ
jgi:hypothetical protein